MDNKNNMNDRQRIFCDEYIKTGNTTQSAVSAGYAPKTAYSQGHRLLQIPKIKKYIENEMNKLHDETIADATEILKYLTSVVRGKSSAEVIVVEGIGDGLTKGKKIMKAPDEKERLKAAELLAKRYGLLKENINVESVLPIVIVDDLDDAEEVGKSE